MTMREINHADWRAEAEAKFGEDPMQWRFVCPSCGHVASVKDYKDAGANEGMVGFSCIGRVLGSKKEIGDKTGGPCNYTGGGLFRLNPVTVVFEGGEKGQYFEFAEQKEVVNG